ncbi:hypothetical protein [Alicyclobacillus dauci]
MIAIKQRYMTLRLLQPQIPNGRGMSATSFLGALAGWVPLP